MATLPKLELIAMAATGYDVVDAEHCRASDLTVVNIRNHAAHTVPEHVFMLALRRKLLAYRRDILEKRWQKVEQQLIDNIEAFVSGRPQHVVV